MKRNKAASAFPLRTALPMWIPMALHRPEGLVDLAEAAGMAKWGLPLTAALKAKSIKIGCRVGKCRRSQTKSLFRISTCAD